MQVSFILFFFLYALANEGNPTLEQGLSLHRLPELEGEDPLQQVKVYPPIQLSSSDHSSKNNVHLIYQHSNDENDILSQILKIKNQNQNLLENHFTKVETGEKRTTIHEPQTRIEATELTQTQSMESILSQKSTNENDEELDPGEQVDNPSNPSPTTTSPPHETTTKPPAHTTTPSPVPTHPQQAAGTQSTTTTETTPPPTTGTTTTTTTPAPSSSSSVNKTEDTTTQDIKSWLGWDEYLSISYLAVTVITLGGCLLGCLLGCLCLRSGMGGPGKVEETSRVFDSDDEDD